MEEIWKDVPDYEGLYQVSNLGRVKSLPKEWVTGDHNSPRRHNGMILKCNINSRGYICVSLCKQGGEKSMAVHQLVAITFLGHNPCGHKLVIDHIDDNPSNNRVDNLQIVTSRFNCRKTQGNYTSKYKGVCWYRNRKKWRSRIYIDGKHKHLGYFDCELAAHHAYKKALKELEEQN
jgi:hypothetical protein